jgi:hypothetical protein
MPKIALLLTVFDEKARATGSLILDNINALIYN